MTPKELQDQALATLKHYDGGRYHNFLLTNILTPEQRATFLASRPSPQHDRLFCPAKPLTWRERLAGRTPATVPASGPALVGVDKLFGSRSRLQETKVDAFALAAKRIMALPDPEPEVVIEDAPELRSRFQEQQRPDPANAWLFGIGSKPAATKPATGIDHSLDFLYSK